MLALRVPAVHALAVHACGMRACASHARVACTCCACPCCACLRCALSCGACGVLVQRSPTPCGARRHRRQHTPDQPLVDPGDLTCLTLSPSSVTYACSCHALIIPPSLPPFLLVFVPPLRVPHCCAGSALCALVLPVCCIMCSARLPRAALDDVTDPTSIVDPGRPDTLSVTYDYSCLSICICLQCCTEGPLHAPQCSCMCLRTAMDLEVPFNKKWLA